MRNPGTFLLYSAAARPPHALANGAGGTARLSVIPQPVRVRPGQGVFEVRRDTVQVVPGAGEAAAFPARFLSNLLQKAAGFELAVRSDVPPEANAIVWGLDAPESFGPEGYLLEVKSDGIGIRARTPAGLFYGMQTLRQLLPDTIESNLPARDAAWTVPVVRIEDRPRFGWRGMHLDVGRHYFGTDRILRFLDLMALHKLNTFHWHLTEDQGWRIEILKYPKLTDIGAYREGTPKSGNRNESDGVRYGSCYTQDEVRKVVAHAAERHITVVPEIEMPGHAAAAIAAYPEFGNHDIPGYDPSVQDKWGVHPYTFNVEDETFAFLEDVLTEVMALFPGPFIHIGGDEAPKTQWQQSANAQARMRAEGLTDERELQSYFVRRIERFLNAHNRRLIGWDEIIEGGLAPHATVMSWRGTDGGVEAARAGHDVVMSPTSHCYLDFYQADPANEPEAIGGHLPLEEVYAYEPVPERLSPEQAAHVLGAQGNLWTEYMHNWEQVEYMALPRMSALAEVVWSPGADRDFNEFKVRLANITARLDRLGVNHRREDR